jgi:co-chaperonin GroES (HSP10)
MNDLRPIGRNVVLARDFGGEKTTEAGIIYNEKITSRLVWSKVVAVGDAVKEDIRVGDRALWDISKVKGQHYKEYDVISDEHIYGVERD